VALVAAVEIILPATALKGRHTKFQIYQSQQTKYYPLISFDTEEAEVYKCREGIQANAKRKGFYLRFFF
jgi:Uma2 family endonuclease